MNQCKYFTCEVASVSYEQRSQHWRSVATLLGWLSAHDVIHSDWDLPVSHSTHAQCVKAVQLILSELIHIQIITGTIKGCPAQAHHVGH